MADFMIPFRLSEFFGIFSRLASEKHKKICPSSPKSGNPQIIL